jgi:arylsulfatase A-like enzyme
LPKGDRYYLTDAISDEAIGFLNDHDEAKDKDPFFLYLAYNAPHFPLHCMPEDYEKYRGRFKEGWDVLRKKKIEKQIKMGLIPANTKLAPRPTTDGKKMGDRGAAVPAWASLDEKKKDEMDAIMATYAAMIDRVDQNVGEVVKHLKETGELENTLIFFLTDNGGEAESGPFGQFKFENLGQYGKGGFKYGRSWATLSNTPFRDYKHFGHQGGIQTPLIVHWPRGVKDELNGKILNQYGFLPDIVQTCLEVAGARRPTERNGKPVPESDGISLVKVLQGSLGPVHTKPICIEHEGNRVVRQGKWKLVSYFDEPWELYDIEADRSESTDLAGAFTAVVDRLDAAYMAFATRAGVIPWEEALEYSVYKN